MIAARVRGAVDLVIDGSFWLGRTSGAVASMLLLDESLFATDFGSRVAFGLGRSWASASC